LRGVRFQTSRFGEIDTPDDTVIEFPSGLIGLGGSRYAIVTTDEDSSFRWLQSLEDPELALPVTNPFQFFSDYAVELSDADSERIGTEDPSGVAVWVIVRAARDAADVTVNLRAPIVVHEGRGWQIINDAPDLDVRTPLFG
jgi:flagellar assembly factor FliW